MMPHEPHNPPQRLLRKYQSPDRPEKLARYYAMCEWFDETVGQLLDHLDRQNLRENTIVLFVIDNGWIQETGPVRTTRGNFAPKSKLSPYDGGLRSPVLIRYPGRVKPARYDDDLVSTIDIVPTLLSAAGIEPPKQMPGLNLLPIASGHGPLRATRSSAKSSPTPPSTSTDPPSTSPTAGPVPATGSSSPSTPTRSNPSSTT
jgi:uncharacterized sulfatase